MSRCLPSANESFHLRGKRNTSIVEREVEWLHSKPITTQMQCFFEVIPQRKGKHPAEAIDGGESPPPVCSENYLRVRIAAEGISEPLQLRSDLLEVVDL